MQDTLIINRGKDENKDRLCHQNVLVLQCGSTLKAGPMMLSLNHHQDEGFSVGCSIEALVRGRPHLIKDKIFENKCRVYTMKDGRTVCIMVEGIEKSENISESFAKVRVDCLPSGRF